jgi:DNA polymerase III epsilon subunit-like protein
LTSRLEQDSLDGTGGAHGYVNIPAGGRSVMTSSKFLVIDCETTGLPRTRYFSPDDVSGWPRLVQIAWGLYDRNGTSAETRCHIIRPQGFKIPPDATKVHGISHARAVREGEDLGGVLDALMDALGRGITALVAHNLDYDYGVVAGELVRLRKPLDVLDVPGICTMKTATPICRLPRPGGGSGFKWPTLPELHGCLFGRTYEGAHDALSDLEACARCFFKLLRDGHFDVI